MPPHQGDHDHHGGDHHDHSHDEVEHEAEHPSAGTGLPLHHRLVRPGAIATGAVIAAVFAVVAHLRSLAAGLVWDDRVFLLEDPRVRRISSMVTAWGDSFFGPLRPNEMYRPLVNASLAFDWWISGSQSGAPTTVWFHAVNLLLHGANAALVYVLLSNITKRKLGAPLIAAVIWAVHPLAVEPVTWIVGRCDLLAAFFGLLAGVVFLRSPGKPRLLWLAAALWGVGMFAKASVAMLPVILLLALVAYHDVDWARLTTPRIRGRFLVFIAPAVAWVAATTLVLGSPFPHAGGVAWKYGSVGVGAALLGTGRALLVSFSHIVLPVGLCGDYSADPAWLGGSLPWVTGILGWAVLIAIGVFGARLLRRSALGFPLLALAVSQVPVLQFARIGAIVADRFLYFPLIFAALALAELLEALYYRWGSRGLAPTLILFALLPTLSSQRGAVWKDDVSFQRDILRQYPGSEPSRYRLAFGLSNTGDPADRAEAVTLLAAIEPGSPEHGDALALLGAIQLEAGRPDEARVALLAAIDDPSTDRLTRAQACFNLASHFVRTNNRDAAVPLLERALVLVPELEPADRLLRSLR